MTENPNELEGRLVQATNPAGHSARADGAERNFMNGRHFHYEKDS